MTIVENQSASSGLSVALLCAALAVSRATFYRRDNEPAKKGPRARSPRALTPVERDAVLATLHSERFVDHAPAEVHAQLLDEGKYLCSTRTIRILESNEEVRERRNQRRHPPHKKPELVATAPNQVWTWDITKLRGPGSTHSSLYVILDIFSRYVVGWFAPIASGRQQFSYIIIQSARCEKLPHGSSVPPFERADQIVAFLLP
jgi:putative transposase